MSLAHPVARPLWPGLLAATAILVLGLGFALGGHGTVVAWLGCGLLAGFSLSGSV